MRVILRNRRTGLYYAICNQWVSDPSQALDFDKIEHAGQLVFEEGLTGLEVVVSYEGFARKLALPIRRQWHGAQLARVAA
jgi:hypothetical protein